MKRLIFLTSFICVLSLLIFWGGVSSFSQRKGISGREGAANNKANTVPESRFTGHETDISGDIKRVYESESLNDWEIVLPANTPQLDTENTEHPIFVRKGQQISIFAWGRVNASAKDTPDDGAYKVVGADGWPSNPEFNIGRSSPLPPAAPFMALAMRIGKGTLPLDDGQWTLIGGWKHLTADSDGYLHFTVNDMVDPAGESDWWSNNEGALTVVVSIRGNGATQFSGRSSVKMLDRRIWRVGLDARDEWYDTGIMLSKGQRITVAASGEWCNGGADPATGPGGLSYTYPGMILKSANLATLIGRVGHSTFAVGRNYSGVVPESGNLFLSMNDLPKAFSDNSGRIEVRIKLTGQNTVPAPRPPISVVGYVDVVETSALGCRIRVIFGEQSYSGFVTFKFLSAVAGRRINNYEDAVSFLDGKEFSITFSGLEVSQNGNPGISFAGIRGMKTLAGKVPNSSKQSWNERTTGTETIIDLSTDILFDFNKSTINPKAIPSLIKLARLIRRSKSGAIQLNGFTDSIGSDEYNLNLSERRADAVRQWLVSNGGIDSSRFSVKGYGEDNPAAPNTMPDGSDNPEGRQKNRRVEVRISRG